MSKSIEFPGTAGNRHDHSINSNQDLTGAMSILAVVRFIGTDGTWQSVIESQSSVPVNKPSMGRHNTGVLYHSDSVAARDFAGITLTAANAWQIIAVTRPAGSAQTVRGHRIIIGGATTHEDDAVTGSDETAYATGKFIVAGDDDPANIRVAAWAIWDGTALSDANINSIGSALTTQSILDLSPTACFDSENSLMLDDLCAGGMDGTLVGSITQSSDGPTGWTYFGAAAPGPPATVIDNSLNPKYLLAGRTTV